MTDAPRAIDFEDAVVDLFMAELRRVWLQYGVPPGAVLNRLRKPRPVSRARMDLAVALREKLGQRFRDGRVTVRAFPDGIPDGWRPASFPVLGGVLGLDHSTLVLAYARAKNLALKEDADAEAADCKDGGVPTFVMCSTCKGTHEVPT